jgi:hypothetical protein
MIGGEPKIGYVLRYAYLWSDDPNAGRDDLGSKERPAVVILSVRRDETHVIVRVAPITHRPPRDKNRAVEIPPKTKQRLGLDAARSWIVLDHANEFVWPGPDLRPVPGREPATVYYGPLPPKLFDTVRQRLLALLREQRVQGNFRSE